MFAIRPRRHRIVLGLFVFSTAAIAACESGPTQPVTITHQDSRLAAFEGDTTKCTRGWVIIDGVVHCTDPQ